ncbi:Hsp70 protein-domain-containing protein [Crucibulum laeve]|uniref:Hsp70 protein-domain-containing protein n=1 Tax=Crucibulum laeve TaxID=68775 RepID=A0A5C3LNC5_9AGAR|nr:Hsp70 protein-domain-containing protein [Crucibulum laeve]
MAPKAAPNGSAEAPIQVSSIPPVVGINFGNSYASIAVFTKEGLAECIANEDGERQIACAIAFHGEEMYIGNQAKHQLIKNSKNTITGFRNLIGKKFSEIPQSTLNISAPVIQHPDLADEPAYKVEVLQPAPSPLPISHHTSNVNTPAASNINTPRSEPIPATRVLSVSEVTTIFLQSLLQSAEDFLGKKVQGAVITIPTWFDTTQRAALAKAASDAGIPVLQLLEEAGAAAGTTTTPDWSSDADLPQDRTQLIIDVGASSVNLTLLSLRSGLSYVLASSTTPNLGGDLIDDRIIKHFATEFTKKTKVPLTVCPATDAADKRAEAKLRLAIEHTKRTVSASPGAATCSVESLKDGVDFTGSINRLRFDMVARPVYQSIVDAVSALLSGAAVDPHDVNEIVYVGGTASLPGLDEHICLTGGFHEDISTPFARGTVVGGGEGDPTTILARGSAAQAALVSSLGGEDVKELKAAVIGEGDANLVRATTKTVGALFPSSAAEDKELGGVFVPLIQKETALPVRRIIELAVAVPASSKFAFELWEVVEGFRTEKVKPPKLSDDEGDDDDDEEEIEVKHRTLTKGTFLGSVVLDAKLAQKGTTTVQIQAIVDIDGDLEVDTREKGEGGATNTLKVAAP